MAELRGRERMLDTTGGRAKSGGLVARSATLLQLWRRGWERMLDTAGCSSSVPSVTFGQVSFGGQITSVIGTDLHDNAIAGNPAKPCNTFFCRGGRGGSIEWFQLRSALGSQPVLVQGVDSFAAKTCISNVPAQRLLFQCELCANNLYCPLGSCPCLWCIAGGRVA